LPLELDFEKKFDIVVHLLQWSQNDQPVTPIYFADLLDVSFKIEGDVQLKFEEKSTKVKV
jgi:hypothetical protein